jgi:hypothetical protein
MAARISILNTANFIILGTRQKSLGINVQGNVLVLFKMQRDPNCEAFDPIFSKLAGQENRVMFAILDLAHNRDVAKWSMETSTQIRAVPLLILYINGKPHARFNGAQNVSSVQGFITKALGAVTNGAGASNSQGVPSSFMPSQNMYGGQNYSQQPKKSWEPDIGKAPSLKGIIKGAPKGYISNGYEEEDEPKLLVPDTVIPHNTPWEAELQERDEF